MSFALNDSFISKNAVMVSISDVENITKKKRYVNFPIKLTPMGYTKNIPLFRYRFHTHD